MYALCEAFGVMIPSSIKSIKLASAPAFIPSHARLLGGGIKFTQANSFTSQSYTYTNTEKLLLHI